MKASELIHQSQGDLVYFEMDGEEHCGSIDNLEIGDHVLMWYVDDCGAYRAVEFEYDEEVTVVEPLGRRA